MHSTLTKCLIWDDRKRLNGTTNMAIDQLLLENIPNTPLLRFYEWKEPSVSFGYFESLARAKAHFCGNVYYIRRLTGGGIVDHRFDLTYTLIFPRSHPWANFRGSESYRIIHQAVANALNLSGTVCNLTGNKPTQTTNPNLCFDSPVEYDIVSSDGQKLAGAGQKRTRQGLLHQGSVIGIHNVSVWKETFIKQLTHSPIPWSPEVSFPSEVSFYKTVNELAEQRYASPEWTAKRP